jgi:hypothetical protein
VECSTIARIFVTVETLRAWLSLWDSEEFSMRTVIQLTCPGTQANSVFITQTDWQSNYGLGHPANSGDTDLLIVALDGDDNALGDTRLAPGQSLPWYRPPSGTVSILIVGPNNCNGTPVFEYDTPCV